MFGTWWLIWMAFIFVFLISPVSYGWGYRGWGPPYPRYIQRRRGLRASVVSGAAPFDHHSWGRGGDFVWLALAVGMLWIAAGMFWPTK